MIERVTSSFKLFHDILNWIIVYFTQSLDFYSVFLRPNKKKSFSRSINMFLGPSLIMMKNEYLHKEKET